jgi:hypothetical protein
MIPVLIVAYRRTASTDDLLRDCIVSGVRKIYLAIDGPKDTDEDISLEFINIIKKYVLAYPRVEIRFWLRTENFGSANSVITAIDWVFESENSMVILEDDLVISPVLMTYFERNISKLSLEDHVMLAGTNPFQSNSGDEVNLVSHFPIVWGWATTRSRWFEMRNGILSNSLRYKSRVPVRIVKFLEVGRMRAQSKSIDAWDVPLAAWMYAEQKICILPPCNLVSNRGYDLHSTHTLSEKWPLNLPFLEPTKQIAMITGASNQLSACIDHKMAKLVLGIKFRHTFSRMKLNLRIFLGAEAVDVSALERSLRKITLP